jgi:hypothetical protein
MPDQDEAPRRAAGQPEVDGEGPRDPQDTDHPAGEEHAAKNRDEEPPG